MEADIIERLDGVSSLIYEENRFDAIMNISKISELYHNGRKEVFVTIFTIMNELLKKEDVIEQLTILRNVDKYTFFHSLNVCEISLMLAIEMGYSAEHLQDLAIGALFHDIGKVVMSQDILKKPGRLSEFEYDEIKKHAVLGYKISGKFSFINEISRNIILYHHERLDGSGYPFGEKGENMDNFARIVAIADVYDAMTTDRIYKSKVTAFSALKYLKRKATVDFDGGILTILIRNICDCKKSLAI